MQWAPCAVSRGGMRPISTENFVIQASPAIQTVFGLVIGIVRFEIAANRWRFESLRIAKRDSRHLSPKPFVLLKFWKFVHAQYDWTTTGVPDNGNERRKFLTVPGSHPVRPHVSKALCGCAAPLSPSHCRGFSVSTLEIKINWHCILN